MTKKVIVILISVISTIAFGGLVYYGLMRARGIPVFVKEPERVVLEVPFIDTDIDLNRGIYLHKWDAIPSKEIELMHQVMILPWGKSPVSPVNVKAFHNREDIYFYISWRDSTENRSVGTGKFTDATAIMFPMKDETQPPTLMMGFLGEANIWQWKASQDEEYWLKKQPKTKAYSDFYYPFEEEELFGISKELPQSAANDLMAIRVGTIAPKQTQNVGGRGYWLDGSWHVVFRRALKPYDPELDAVFTQPLATGAGLNPGKNRLCAFAVWDGERGDRGGRKSISDWVELEVK